MAAKYIFHGCGAVGEPKRQPVGAVRRSPGDFGLFRARKTKVFRASAQGHIAEQCDSGTRLSFSTFGYTRLVPYEAPPYFGVNLENISLKDKAEHDCWVYLKVRSDEPLQSLSAYFGQEGMDRSWSKGEQRQLGRGVYPFSMWTIQSGLPRGSTIEDHLVALWRRVENVRERLLDRPATYEATLQFVSYYPKREDEFCISAGHLTTAAYYQLNVDFDFYYSGYSDDEERDSQTEDSEFYWKW